MLAHLAHFLFIFLSSYLVSHFALFFMLLFLEKLFLGFQWKRKSSSSSVFKQNWNKTKQQKNKVYNSKQARNLWENILKAYYFIFAFRRLIILLLANTIEVYWVYTISFRLYLYFLPLVMSKDAKLIQMPFTMVISLLTPMFNI